MFDGSCAFHEAGAGPSHQLVSPPAAAAPETLATIRELATAEAGRLPRAVAEVFRRPFPVEIKLLDPEAFLSGAPQQRRDFWFRMPTARAVAGEGAQQALLALMSDYWLPGAVMAPHGATRPLRFASLGHSLWLHLPERADKWLLYATESHWAAHGRGLARGHVFDRTGRLVATVMQEAMVRWSDQPARRGS